MERQMFGKERFQKLKILSSVMLWQMDKMIENF